MRAQDHQLQQALYVSRMERAGSAGVRFDAEGSGYGFKTVRRFEALETTLPTSCRMQRPE
jgi:branched-chain amino acid transport system substrate-binding protein